MRGPLTSDKEGNEWWHLFNYFQGPTFNSFVPFVFSFGTPGAEHFWALPFYMQGPGYKLLFPIAYSVGEEGKKYWGIAPLFFQNPKSLLIPPLMFGNWDLADGGRSTWVTPFFHQTKNGEGKYWWHLFNYFQGPGYKSFFPFVYSFDDGSFGILPFITKSHDHLFIPALFSGVWKRKGGGKTIWITPFFHTTSSGEGNNWWHLFNYFHGPESDVIFPFFYQSGKTGEKQIGVVPFYFQGPDYMCAPLLLSGRWEKRDGGKTTWITPFFHETDDAGGNLKYLHALNWFQGKDHQVLFPFFWNFHKKLTMVPPLYMSKKNPDGGTSRSFLWPLSEFRTGNRLDKSLSVELKPFVYQQAGEDYEFNFLWKILHLGREKGRTSIGFQPLWWSEHPDTDEPSQFQLLGGLFAKDCNYRKKTYQYRLLWFIPLGGKGTF